MKRQVFWLMAGVLIAIWSRAAEADAAPAAKPLEQIDVYLAGQGDYHTYRIPSVIVSKKGTVLAFCEGRRRGTSDSGDIDLLVKRSDDGGRTFSPQQIVWNDGANTCGNPCPVVEDQTGAILLLMTHNLGSDKQADIVAQTGKGTRTVWITESRDDARTWSPPKEITADVKRPNWTWYATGPGAGIQLKSGRLLIPCDHKEAGTKTHNSHVIYSDDRGTSWKLGGVVGPDTNECEAVELADGALLLNMRNYNRDHKCRAVAKSKDGGLSWSEIAYDAALIEPVCQASIRRYRFAQDGGRNRLLFSNPAATGRRANLTVRLSEDEGKSWPVSRVLHPGPAAYSCLAVLPDGTILCLYERGEKTAYEKITLARFRMEAAGPASAGKGTVPLSLRESWDSPHNDPIIPAGRGP
jgi:sialidase-1